MRKHGTIRFVRVTLATPYLDHLPVCQALSQAGILVRVPARFLDESRSHALMLGSGRLIDARMEAALGRTEVVEQHELDVLRTDFKSESRQSVEILGIGDELRYDDVVASNKMNARHPEAQVARRCPDWASRVRQPPRSPLTMSCSNDRASG